MKVLHVIPGVSKEDGGPSNAIFPMCRALIEKGVDVVLATTDHGLDVSSFGLGVPSSKGAGVKMPIRKSEFGTRNDYQGVPTIFFSMQLGQSFKYSPSFSRWLDKNVAGYDVVHIHAVFNHSSIAAASACRKVGVPYVVRPLGTLDPWGMNQKSLRKKLFWKTIAKKMLTAAAAIHYTSLNEQQAVEQSLALNYGVVVPLGVEERANSGVGNNSVEELADLGARPFVLVLSRLLPTKGLDILLDAFLSLITRPEFQSWRLVLAGEGPSEYVTSLRQTVAKRFASDFVVFPGWLNGEAKENALMNASLLALPSHHENFGLCVMEALAHGVPVLISPQVNLAPDIEAAGAGWVADVNRGALEAALADALSSQEELQRRGAAGRNLARQFTWAKIAAQLCDLYTSVVTNSGTAPPKSECL